MGVVALEPFLMRNWLIRRTSVKVDLGDNGGLLGEDEDEDEDEDEISFFVERLGDDDDRHITCH